MPGRRRRLKIFIQDKVFAEWRYKLAALLAAFVMWAYVAGQQSMQAVYTVPIYFQNLPADSEIVDQKVHTVEVTVSGRRDLILSLRERQIWISIDLSGMNQGRNVYRITDKDIVVPSGIEVKNVARRKLVIRLALKKKPEKKPPE